MVQGDENCYVTMRREAQKPDIVHGDETYCTEERNGELCRDKARVIVMNDSANDASTVP